MMVSPVNTHEAITTRLDQALTTIARLAPQLDDVLASHGSARRFGSLHRRNPRSRPPLNVSVLHLIIELEDCPVCGVRQHLAVTGEANRPIARSGEALAWWLAYRASGIAAHSWSMSKTWWSQVSGSSGASWLDEIEAYAETLELLICPPVKHPPAGTVTEVSLWCGVPAETVRTWRRRGQLQDFKQGGTWLYRTSDVAALAERRAGKNAA